MCTPVLRYIVDQNQDKSGTNNYVWIMQTTGKQVIYVVESS